MLMHWQPCCSSPMPPGKAACAAHVHCEPRCFTARGTYHSRVQAADCYAMECSTHHVAYSCMYRPKLCYTIPVHNNPTGATIPERNRVKLLQLAHHHNFLILADEVYQLLTFSNSQPPPPPMRAVEQSMFKQGLLRRSAEPGPAAPSPPPTPAAAPAGAGGTASGGGSVSTPYSSRVVSLGSFSKIMAPGLRLGWVDAAPDLLQKLQCDGVLGSGGSIAPLASGIAHSCLELGLLHQHLQHAIRPTLQRNCTALCEALRQELPAGCSFRQPQGGYFVWITLPDEVSSGVTWRLVSALRAGAACWGAYCVSSPQAAQSWELKSYSGTGRSEAFATVHMAADSVHMC
jgi:DNA-binding transcriptional MocR family regulator